MTELQNVWENSDTGFLIKYIPFFVRGAAKKKQLTILDATFGNGVFWKDWEHPYRLITMDCETGKDTPSMVQADNRELPFSDAVFDVIVYDPPHITHGWSKWDQAKSYGVATGKGSIAYLFPAFLREALRTLKPNGIIMAKIADQIHSGRKFFQHAEFLVIVDSIHGLTPCDFVTKTREHNRPQPSGTRQLHTRSVSSFWITVRKGRC